MKTTNATQVIITNYITEISNENEKLKERVNEMESQAKDTNFLMKELTKVTARAEEAETKLKEIKAMSAYDFIRVGNQFKKMKTDPDYDVSRSWHSTRRNLELIGKLEIVESFSKNIKEEKIKERKQKAEQDRRDREKQIKKRIKEQIAKRQDESRQKAINTRRLLDDIFSSD